MALLLVWLSDGRNHDILRAFQVFHAMLEVSNHLYSMAFMAALLL
jgi:hypothetical protein